MSDQATLNVFIDSYANSNFLQEPYASSNFLQKPSNLIGWTWK